MVDFQYLLCLLRSCGDSRDASSFLESDLIFDFQLKGYSGQRSSDSTSKFAQTKSTNPDKFRLCNSLSSLLNVEELQCGSFYDSISGHTDLSPSHNLLDLLRKRNEFIQNRLTGWKLLVELLLIDRDSDHKYYSIAWSCIMKLLERGIVEKLLSYIQWIVRWKPHKLTHVDLEELLQFSTASTSSSSSSSSTTTTAAASADLTATQEVKFARQSRMSSIQLENTQTLAAAMAAEFQYVLVVLSLLLSGGRTQLTLDQLIRLIQLLGDSNYELPSEISELLSQADTTTIDSFQRWQQQSIGGIYSHVQSLNYETKVLSTWLLIAGLNFPCASSSSRPRNDSSDARSVNPHPLLQSTGSDAKEVERKCGVIGELMKRFENLNDSKNFLGGTIYLLWGLFLSLFGKSVVGDLGSRYLELSCQQSGFASFNRLLYLCEVVVMKSIAHTSENNSNDGAPLIESVWTSSLSSLFCTSLFPALNAFVEIELKPSQASFRSDLLDPVVALYKIILRCAPSMSASFCRDWQLSASKTISSTSAASVPSPDSLADCSSVSSVVQVVTTYCSNDPKLLFKMLSGLGERKENVLSIFRILDKSVHVITECPISTLKFGTPATKTGGLSTSRTVGTKVELIQPFSSPFASVSQYSAPSYGLKDLCVPVVGGQGVYIGEAGESGNNLLIRWDLKARWIDLLLNYFVFAPSVLHAACVTPSSNLSTKMASLLEDCEEALMLVRTLFSADPQLAGRYFSCAWDDKVLACSLTNLRFYHLRHPLQQIGATVGDFLQQSDKVSRSLSRSMPDCSQSIEVIALQLQSYYHDCNSSQSMITESLLNILYITSIDTQRGKEVLLQRAGIVSHTLDILSCMTGLQGPWQLGVLRAFTQSSKAGHDPAMIPFLLQGYSSTAFKGTVEDLSVTRFFRSLLKSMDATVFKSKLQALFDVASPSNNGFVLPVEFQRNFQKRGYRVPIHAIELLFRSVFQGTAAIGSSRLNYAQVVEYLTSATLSDTSSGNDALEELKGLLISLDKEYDHVNIVSIFNLKRNISEVILRRLMSWKHNGSHNYETMEGIISLVTSLIREAEHPPSSHDSSLVANSRHFVENLLSSTDALHNLFAVATSVAIAAFDAHVREETLCGVLTEESKFFGTRKLLPINGSDDTVSALHELSPKSLLPLSFDKCHYTRDSLSASIAAFQSIQSLFFYLRQQANDGGSQRFRDNLISVILRSPHDHRGNESGIVRDSNRNSSSFISNSGHPKESFLSLLVGMIHPATTATLDRTLWPVLLTKATSVLESVYILLSGNESNLTNGKSFADFLGLHNISGWCRSMVAVLKLDSSNASNQQSGQIDNNSKSLLRVHISIWSLLLRICQDEPVLFSLLLSVSDASASTSLLSKGGALGGFPVFHCASPDKSVLVACINKTLAQSELLYEICPRLLHVLQEILINMMESMSQSTIAKIILQLLSGNTFWSNVTYPLMQDLILPTEYQHEVKLSNFQSILSSRRSSCEKELQDLLKKSKQAAASIEEHVFRLLVHKSSLKIISLERFGVLFGLGSEVGRRESKKVLDFFERATKTHRFISWTSHYTEVHYKSALSAQLNELSSKLGLDLNAYLTESSFVVDDGEIDTKTNKTIVQLPNYGWNYIVDVDLIADAVELQCLEYSVEEGTPIADSKLSTWFQFLELAAQANSMWSIADAEIELMQSFGCFLEIYVQPNTPMRLKDRKSEKNADFGEVPPQEPPGSLSPQVSATGSSSPSHQGKSGFTGDKRSYEILGKLSKQLVFSDPQRDGNDANGTISTTEAKILNEKLKIFVSMLHHQLRDIRVKTLDPGQSQTEMRDIGSLRLDANRLEKLFILFMNLFRNLFPKLTSNYKNTRNMVPNNGQNKLASRNLSLKEHDKIVMSAVEFSAEETNGTWQPERGRRHAKDEKEGKLILETAQTRILVVFLMLLQGIDELSKLQGFSSEFGQERQLLFQYVTRILIRQLPSHISANIASNINSSDGEERLSSNMLYACLRLLQTVIPTTSTVLLGSANWESWSECISSTQSLFVLKELFVQLDDNSAEQIEKSSTNYSHWDATILSKSLGVCLAKIQERSNEVMAVTESEADNATNVQSVNIQLGILDLFLSLFAQDVPIAHHSESLLAILQSINSSKTLLTFQTMLMDTATLRTPILMGYDAQSGEFSNVAELWERSLSLVTCVLRNLNGLAPSQVDDYFGVISSFIHQYRHLFLLPLQYVCETRLSLRQLQLGQASIRFFVELNRNMPAWRSLGINNYSGLVVETISSYLTHLSSVFPCDSMNVDRNGTVNVVDCSTTSSSREASPTTTPLSDKSVDSTPGDVGRHSSSGKSTLLDQLPECMKEVFLSLSNYVIAVSESEQSGFAKLSKSRVQHASPKTVHFDMESSRVCSARAHTDNEKQPPSQIWSFFVDAEIEIAASAVAAITFLGELSPLDVSVQAMKAQYGSSWELSEGQRVLFQANGGIDESNNGHSSLSVGIILQFQPTGFVLIQTEAVNRANLFLTVPIQFVQFVRLVPIRFETLSRASPYAKVHVASVDSSGSNVTMKAARDPFLIPLHVWENIAPRSSAPLSTAHLLGLLSHCTAELTRSRITTTSNSELNDCLVELAEKIACLLTTEYIRGPPATFVATTPSSKPSSSSSLSTFLAGSSTSNQVPLSNLNSAGGRPQVPSLNTSCLKSDAPLIPFHESLSWIEYSQCIEETFKRLGLGEAQPRTPTPRKERKSLKSVLRYIQSPEELD